MLMMVRELDPKLWRHLPSEILAEQVLRWLPFPTLCRFRAVCKYWNLLPALRREEPYLLDIPCNSPEEDALRFCYLYSPRTNIWNQIDLSFVLASMSRLCYWAQSWTPQVERYCSDGGLLCVWGKFTKASTSRPQRASVMEYNLLVVNPVTKNCKILPSFDLAGRKPRDLVMHRESSGRYKVFASTCDVSTQALRLVMYDSVSNAWKVLLNFEPQMDYICSIIFEGVFYCLLRPIETLEPFDLFAYDIVQDAWFAYDVKQDSGKPGSMKIEHWLLRSPHHLSFVVSNGSLHLVASGWDEAHQMIPYFSTHKLDLSGTEMMIASTRCVPRPKSMRTWIAGATFEYRNSIILAADAKRRVAGVDLFSWAAHLTEEYFRDFDNLADSPPRGSCVHPNGLKPITQEVKRPRLGSSSRYYLNKMKKVTFDMQTIP